jgi:hypothetical protein
VLAGQEGTGKTTLLADLLARASTGSLEGDLRGEPVASVYATAEDSWARTLRPRLEAARADLSLVHFVEIEGQEVGLTIPTDLDRLACEMQRVRARLLVLDPLSAHLHASLDTHRDASVRRALAPLAACMDSLEAVAVGVMHWSKAPTKEALDRVNGSRGFTAAARSILAVGPDPLDEGSRVLVVVKSNLGRPDVPALRFRVESRTVSDANGATVETSGVTWLGEAEGITARDLFPASGDGGDRSDRSAAVEVVAELLEERPHTWAELDAAIHDAGLEVSRKSVQRILNQLRVVRSKSEFGGAYLLSRPR